MVWTPTPPATIPDPETILELLTRSGTDPATGYITPADLSTAWQAFLSRDYWITPRPGTWTPTLTNVNIGTGGSAARVGTYVYIPGVLVVDIGIVLGTTGFSVTGNPSISLPAGFACERVNTTMAGDLGVSLISGGTYAEGVAHHSTANSITVLARTASGPYVGRASITAAIPATWAPGDAIIITGVIKGTMA